MDAQPTPEGGRQESGAGVGNSQESDQVQFRFVHVSPSSSIASEHKLARPAMSAYLPDFTTGILAEKFPALKGVPTPYVIKWIKTHGPALYEMGQQSSDESTAKSKRPASSLLHTFLPSHVFAVPGHVIEEDAHVRAGGPTGSSALPSSTQGLMFPVHDLIYLAQCTYVPTQLVQPRNRDMSGGVPVVPLSIPSLRAMPLLHRWLYTHDVLPLVGRLLFPLEGQAVLRDIMDAELEKSSSESEIWESFDLEERVEYIVHCAALDKEESYHVIQRFIGLYKNACAFAVVDYHLSLVTADRGNVGAKEKDIAALARLRKLRSEFSERQALILEPIESLSTQYGFWEVMNGIWKALQRHSKSFATDQA